MSFRASDDTFKLNDIEREKAEQWLNEHSKNCGMIHPPARHLDVSGGLISYIFIPTSVGVGVSVRCACKEEFDVTDYNSW